MIDHLQFRMLAAAAIDEPLESREAAALAEHLAGCATCRSVAAALASDHRRLGELDWVPTAPRVREVVRGAARRGQRPSVWTMLAAAVLLIALVAGSLAVGSYLIRLRQAQPLELTTEWQSVPSDVLTIGASTSRIHGVTSTSDGFVAVGSAGGSAAVWLSADGSAWEQIGGLPGGKGAELITIEVGDGRLIAVGRSGGGTAIWTSQDGRGWDAAGPLDALAGGSINGLARGPDGWLAVGGSVIGGGAQGATWRSVDGLVWTRTLPKLPDAFFQVLNGVALLPDGRWVAFPDLPITQGPYTSVDGITWSLAVDLVAANDLRAITPFTARFVGIGRVGVVPRWSVDGRIWIDATIPVGLAGDLATATVLGAEVVLLGGGRNGPILLRSSDGLTFAADALGPGGQNATAYDVAALAGVEAVVGIQNGVGAVWVRRR